MNGFSVFLRNGGSFIHGSNISRTILASKVRAFSLGVVNSN